MAFGLAAYVSRAGYPADRARLASRCWSGSPGRAYTRRVPIKGFNSLHVGLFDWLTGKKARVEAEDRIWLTQQARSAAIRKEVAQAVADPAGPYAIMVVAHFKNCLEQLHAEIAGFDQDRLLLTLADSLGGRTPTDFPVDESRNILIIVGERHPLPSHDEAVLDFARSLPCRCRLVYHISLEDAFMKRFGGDWMKDTLRRMGMKEDEVVGSRMVSRRIRLAQRKIARVSAVDPVADSAEEWFERNCQG